MVDLKEVGVVLALLVPLAGLLGWLFRLSYRFKQLEEHDREATEVRGLLLEGVAAALDGLVQLGANGNAKEADKKLKGYLYKK